METAKPLICELELARCSGGAEAAEARSFRHDLPYDLFEDDLSSDWKGKCGVSHFSVSFVAGIDRLFRGRVDGASVDEDEVSL